MGEFLDSQNFTTNYTQNHVTQWVQGLSHLSLIAAMQPHAEYVASSCAWLLVQIKLLSPNYSKHP